MLPLSQHPPCRCGFIVGDVLLSYFEFVSKFCLYCILYIQYGRFHLRAFDYYVLPAEVLKLPTRVIGTSLAVG